MARYDRSYDFGLRGYRETAGLRGYRETAGFRSGRGYDAYFGHGVGQPPLPNRVTSRYNRDYTYDRPYRGFERNPNSFGGDREGRVGDFRYYERPYTTIGGTRTGRGAVPTPRPYSSYEPYDREFGRGR